MEKRSQFIRPHGVAVTVKPLVLVFGKAFATKNAPPTDSWECYVVWLPSPCDISFSFSILVYIELAFQLA